MLCERIKEYLICIQQIKSCKEYLEIKPSTRGYNPVLQKEFSLMDAISVTHKNLSRRLNKYVGALKK
jgi:hypothetical protein